MIHPWRLPPLAYTDPQAWNAALDRATTGANTDPEAAVKLLSLLTVAAELEIERDGKSSNEEEAC